jgi:uncharacterized membrane protein YebE (DUF533 family)
VVSFITQIFLGVLFVAGCFVVFLGFGALTNFPDRTVSVSVTCASLLTLAGLAFLGRLAFSWYKNWWSNVEPPSNLTDTLNQSAESWFNQTSDELPSQDNENDET